MAHRPANAKVLAIGIGALLAPVFAPVAASADPDDGSWMAPAPLPPATAGSLTSEPLARGSAGEFSITDAETGFTVAAPESTDVAMVRATLAARSSIPWHRHVAKSLVVVASGTLRLIHPDHGDHEGCTETTHPAGSSFVHPKGQHAIANDGDEPAVFYVVYFVPEGANPAPIPAEAPSDC
jgi:quercetin dioxygenase-like cupin family protein